MTAMMSSAGALGLCGLLSLAVVTAHGDEPQAWAGDLVIKLVPPKDAEPDWNLCEVRIQTRDRDSSTGIPRSVLNEQPSDVGLTARWKVHAAGVAGLARVVCCDRCGNGCRWPDELVRDRFEQGGRAWRWGAKPASGRANSGSRPSRCRMCCGMRSTKS